MVGDCDFDGSEKNLRAVQYVHVHTGTHDSKLAGAESDVFSRFYLHI